MIYYLREIPKINPQGLILGGAKYGGFLLALICFSGFFFEEGGYFWNLSKLFLFHGFSDSRCSVLSSSKYFLQKIV